MGRLGIVDHDRVEASNLHRQVGAIAWMESLCGQIVGASGSQSTFIHPFTHSPTSIPNAQVIHAEGRAGWKKVESAAAAIRALNSGVEVVTYDEVRFTNPPITRRLAAAALPHMHIYAPGPFLTPDRPTPTYPPTHTLQPFTPANAARLVAGYDLVVDASDNPATRYLLNDACVLLPSLPEAPMEDRGRRKGRRVPLVSGAAVGAEGQVCGCGCDRDGRLRCYMYMLTFHPST